MADPSFTVSVKRRRLTPPPEKTGSSFVATSSTNESSDMLRRPNFLPEGYPCATCGNVWRTKSDFKKDEARHQRPHKCYIEGCHRVYEGFSTINDLNRHLKGVHGVAVEGTVDYKCLVAGCAKADKTWPRLDNFRQHVVRMHPEEDVDFVVQQSRQWFQNNMPNLTPPHTRTHVPRARSVPSPQQAHTFAPSSAPQQRLQPGSGLHLRRLSLSSGPGGTPNAECQFGTSPAVNCQISPQGLDTPEILTTDHSDHYPPTVDGKSTIGWAQQQGENFAGTIPDPLVIPYSEGFGETGTEAYRLHPSLSQHSFPSLEVSSLTEHALPIYQQRTSDPYPGRADSVLTRLQLLLAGFNPPAGNALDIVMNHHLLRRNLSLRDSGNDNQDASAFATGTLSAHSSTTSPFITDNSQEGIATFGSGPDLYVACPFHKHNVIIYAACQGYRAKTVDELYHQHILPYHARRGHISGAVLERLANLRGSNLGEHWYTLYRELFVGDLGIEQLHLPSPFWMPTVSTTNLEDLVRAAVDLSAQEVSIPTNSNPMMTTPPPTTTPPQPTSMSFSPFHIRFKKICHIVREAINAELAQVHWRWEAVRNEAVTRLATNSQFDPSILYGISVGPPPCSQPPSAPAVAAAHSQVTSHSHDLVQPGRLGAPQSAIPNMSADENNDVLHLSDYNSRLGNNNSTTAATAISEEPLPLTTIAASANVFASRTYENEGQSRRSTPNDSGYLNNLCKWVPEDDDPELCKLCGKTQNLHETGYVRRQH